MGGARDVLEGAPGAATEGSSRYEILARIASGGMATVFVARARGAAGFSRLVAIKRAHPFVSADPFLRRSLMTEAHIVSAIHHPHVVSVLDVELLGDDVCLVLDYVEGCSLAELLSRSRRAGTTVPVPVGMRVILDAASGLHAAHVLCDERGGHLGLVHRDVSPQNILVGLDGHARLTDFGIAKVADENLEQTATNVLKGKLSYMSPEYLESKAFDARSDQYALAVVAWETLTSERLFSGDSEVEVLRRIVSEPVRPPSRSRADLAPFDDVFARALAHDPADRFASVQAFATALEDRARQLGWVAPHADVASRVDWAVGDLLRQRRSDVEARMPISTSGIAARPALPRDALITRSLPGDSLPPPPALSPTAVSAPVATITRRWTRRRAVLVGSAAVCLVGGVSTGLALHTRAARSAASAGDTPSAEISGALEQPSSPPPSGQAPAAAATAPNSVPVDSLPAASAASQSVARPTRAPSRPQPAPARPASAPPAHSHSSAIRYHDPG
jgi:serine/threonine-protein kinase